jgi:hypothetical protein
MRALLITAVLAGIAGPAYAQKIPSQFFGIWGGELVATKECRAAAFPHDGSLLVKVDGNGIEGTEFGCKVRSATPVRSGTWSFNMDCSGEGLESKTTELWQRVQIGTRSYLVRALVSGHDRAIEVFLKCR